MEDLKKLADEELILLLNKSSEKAFHEVYNRYVKKLLAQAKWDIGDDAEAEDCVQEVFIRLWNCRKNLSIRYKLSTYLYRAVKNQTINQFEKKFARRNHVLPLSEIDLIPVAPAADVPLLEKEMQLALENAINSLPEKCSKIYRMSRLDENSNKEIAAKLGIAEKTVEGHMTRAIKHVSGSVSGSIIAVFLILVLRIFNI